MSDNKVVFTAQQINSMLDDMAKQIKEQCPQTVPCLVGIRTGGVHLAARLAAILAKLYNQPILSGVLDINLYRDDWSIKHHKPLVQQTEINFDLQDKYVVLVDDVLYTGRTIRAALEALLDLGRPTRIELAVLIDRGGRELPIAPNYVGAFLPTKAPARVDVLLSEQGHEDMVRLQLGQT